MFNNYKARAVLPTHLDDLIDEAHMSNRVSLLHQDLLQMLHLKKHAAKKPSYSIHQSCCCLGLWF